MRSLNSMTLHGFKSIRELDKFELREVNVLIGANGAGKSNFVDFFRMLRTFADESLQKFVNQQGGGDAFFFMGPKITREITARLEFGQNVYQLQLQPTADGSLQITEERVQYTGGRGLGGLRLIGSGNRESQLKSRKDEMGITGAKYGVPSYVYDAVSSWLVYHFHDTSMSAAMRRDQEARDNDSLRNDAANIAAFLLRLREDFKDSYALIRDTVRMIAPFFDDFLLRLHKKGGEEKVRLEWRQKGSDFPFQPLHLSDGTIRFICLATALLQPDPPSTVLIDEPELGLHPVAIALLADLIHSASERTQLIVSTQSPLLLDHFEPEEIVVVNRKDDQTTFHRLDSAELKEWLEEYSVGELWQKNVVRGGPGHG